MAKELIPKTSRAVQFLFRLWSGFYDHPISQRLFYGRIHTKLLDTLDNKEFTSILDVGCGTGELLKKMSSRWPEADFAGLDVSPDMLSVAKNKSYECNSIFFMNDTVYKLPVEDNRFDLITSTISSHFYLDFDLALQELLRVLKPGGLLVMASLSNGVLRFLPGSLGHYVAAPHLVLRSPKYQQQTFRESGFEDVSAKYLMYPAWLFIGSKPYLAIGDSLEPEPASQHVDLIGDASRVQS